MNVEAEITELHARVQVLNEKNSQLLCVINDHNKLLDRMLSVLEGMSQSVAGNTEAIEGIHQQLALLRPTSMGLEET